VFFRKRFNFFKRQKILNFNWSKYSIDYIDRNVLLGGFLNGDNERYFQKG
jgi:hypothetical protein